MADQAITALYSLAGLLGFWFLTFFVWKSYRISKLRQDLFDLRADLFDFVLSSNGISFDHPAYRHLRTLLNSLIRFAHRLTFVHFLTTMLITRPRNPESVLEQWENLVRGLRPDVRRELDRIRVQIVLAVLVHIIRIPVSVTVVDLSSSVEQPRPADRLLVPVTNPATLGAELTRNYKAHLVATVRDLEQQAVEHREEELVKQKAATAVAGQFSHSCL